MKTFLKDCKGYNHEYSVCRVYGLTEKELLEILSTVERYVDIFHNGVEEEDGSLSFEAYRISPYDMVELLDAPGRFVFAWEHWDIDSFCCSKYTEMDVKSVCETGDEPDMIIATFDIVANGKYKFHLGAGDFDSGSIGYYHSLPEYAEEESEDEIADRKKQMIEVLEQKALLYESGRMLRDDSEVEIGLSTDEDGDDFICVNDYSRSRGSSEVIEVICPVGDVDKDKVVELCGYRHWFCCI